MHLQHQNGIEKKPRRKEFLQEAIVTTEGIQVSFTKENHFSGFLEENQSNCLVTTILH